MLTANEQLFDALTRHQVHVLRYGAGLSQRAIRKLRESDEELIRVVDYFVGRREGRPTTDRAARRALRALRREIKSIRSLKPVKELLDAELRELASDEADFLLAAVAVASPVILKTAKPGAADLMAATRKPFMGQTLSQWLTGAERNDQNRIVRATMTGLGLRETREEVMRRVKGTSRLRGADGAMVRVRNDIASITQTATTSTATEAKVATRAASVDLRFVQFTATLDSKTTPICVRNDTKVFEYNKGPQPPLHIRCRSVLVDYLSHAAIAERPYDPTTQKLLLKEYVEQRGLKNVGSRDALPRGQKTAFDNYARQRRRALLGRVPDRLSYSQWFQRQSAGFQDEVLGSVSGKAFRSGNLPLDKFIAGGTRFPTVQDLRLRGLLE